MKLRTLAFRGITRFQGEPVRLDFDSMGPGLIAFVGANGQGKTTALEAVPACLYKGLPTRPGSLYDHAHGRDAFIEAEFFGQDADQIKVRLQVDADRKTTEGYVFVNGKPITSGRAKEFEAEIERLFGSEALFLASAFSAQSKAGSFLTMDKRSRKDLFVQLLGISYLQTLSERAREKKVAADGDLNVARRLLQAAKDEAEKIEMAEDLLSQARSERRILSAAIETAQDMERKAGDELQQVKGAYEKRGLLTQARERAALEVRRAEAACVQADVLPSRAEQAAASRRQSIGLQNPDEMEAAAKERGEKAMLRLAGRHEEAEATLRCSPEVDAATSKIEEVREEERGIRRRETALAQAVAERNTAQARMDGAIRQLEAEDKRVVLETGRLGRQAQAMKDAPCTKSAIGWRDTDDVRYEMVDLAGTCPLLKEARTATRAILEVQVDAGIRSAAGAARVAHATLAEKTRELQEEFDSRWAGRVKEIANLLPMLEKTAARAGEMDAARKILAEAEADKAGVERQMQSDLDAIQDLRESIFTETASIAAELTAALTAAASQIHQANEAHTQALTVYEQAAKVLAEDPPPPFLSDVQARADIAVSNRATIEREITESDMKIGRLEGDVSAAKGHAIAAKHREEEASGAEERVGDWARLERALGRDGAQALAIDAAGPEVASITNELLSAYPGRQFSIALETLREKKSAKGEFAEAFDIKVFDGAIERQVEALSGGERVVVGEALGLALAIFNSRKSGIQWRTLFRDETAGALDPENAAAYVEMLRRALQLGGFEQVLFVSHSPDVWQRADVRLFVHDGRIVVHGAE